MSSIRCQGIAATDRLVMPTCRWSKGPRDHEEREGGKAEREREDAPCSCSRRELSLERGVVEGRH